MKKPMIGVLPLVDDEKASYWMLPGYMKGIQKAGGIPIMLPLTTEEDVLAQCMQVCDGFLLTGDMMYHLYFTTKKSCPSVVHAHQKEMRWSLQL